MSRIEQARALLRDDRARSWAQVEIDVAAALEHAHRRELELARVGRDVIDAWDSCCAGVMGRGARAQNALTARLVAALGELRAALDDPSRISPRELCSHAPDPTGICQRCGQGGL